jgi:hypothetical protein
MKLRFEAGVGSVLRHAAIQARPIICFASYSSAGRSAAMSCSTVTPLVRTG